MTRKNVEKDGKRVFNVLWERELFFIEDSSGNPFCLICETSLSHNRKHDLLRHFNSQHRDYIEKELKLLAGSQSRDAYISLRKGSLKSRQNLFSKQTTEDLATIEASYAISLILAKKRKPYSDGEELIKPCLKIFSQYCKDQRFERKAQEIPLSRKTVIRRIEELSQDVSQQLQLLINGSECFSIAMDESTDISGVAHLTIFIRGVDQDFNSYEELASLESLHNTTRGVDIFEKVKSCLSYLNVNFDKLISVCTDGAPSMVGKNNGAVSLLENFLGRSISKYHCLIHQESLCGNVLDMKHVMLSVIKCVNKIRAKALYRRKFREYCELLDLEYGDLLLHCEIRWLSNGRVLNRFWELRDAVYGFLEEEGELYYERGLLHDNEWPHDLAFLVVITFHLNVLNLKIQGQNKLFPSLVNNITAFTYKLQIFISQLKERDFNHFPTLKEQIFRASNNSNVEKYINKIEKLLQTFKDRFQDVEKEKNNILIFTNPFVLNEDSIMKASIKLQMELIDLKTSLFFKGKFDELASNQNEHEIASFWRLLPEEEFPELKRFAKGYICRFGTTYRCEQAFSSMKLIKSKARSRITDSNLKNSIRLAITNLEPDIRKLAASKQLQNAHNDD